MRAGGLIAIIALGGCASGERAVEIRATKAPVSAVAKPVPARIAEARAQFALGNVALSLEGFRKALRDDPNSIDARLGMASCYDRMQRFDLSRRNFEAALALAPADVRILSAFASSLDGQGLKSEAAAVRLEVAERRKIVPAALKAPPLPTALSAAIAPAASAPVVTVPRTGPGAIAQPKAEVTVRLPAPKPVVPVAHVAGLDSGDRAVPAPQAGAAKAARLPAPAAQMAARNPAEPAARPRLELERVSMGEVALLTSGRLQWKPQVVRRSAESTTVRFVPLQRPVAIAQARIRLLNAARRQGLAARTRTYLAQRGWQKMAIGNAPATRQRSVILYPVGQRDLAKRLSAQFGFAMQRRMAGRDIILLLGRDASPAMREREGA